MSNSWARYVHACAPFAAGTDACLMVPRTCFATKDTRHWYHGCYMKKGLQGQFTVVLTVHFREIQSQNLTWSPCLYIRFGSTWIWVKSSDTLIFDGELTRTYTHTTAKLKYTYWPAFWVSGFAMRGFLFSWQTGLPLSCELLNPKAREEESSTSFTGFHNTSMACPNSFRAPNVRKCNARKSYIVPFEKNCLKTSLNITKKVLTPCCS